MYADLVHQECLSIETQDSLSKSYFRSGLMFECYKLALDI